MVTIAWREAFSKRAPVSAKPNAWAVSSRRSSSWAASRTRIRLRKRVRVKLEPMGWVSTSSAPACRAFIRLLLVSDRKKMTTGVHSDMAGFFNLRHRAVAVISGKLSFSTTMSGFFWRRFPRQHGLFLFGKPDRTRQLFCFTDDAIGRNTIDNKGCSRHRRDTP